MEDRSVSLVGHLAPLNQSFIIVTTLQINLKQFLQSPKQKSPRTQGFRGNID